MPDGPAVIYRYDGTFDGFLTAVFEAYARRLP
ncbi:MAG TPA: DNA metabolism protein, partial [Clostridiales bacterium]|nr:DNA metabolism protein [Clostridiales bacterium]